MKYILNNSEVFEIVNSGDNYGGLRYDPNEILYIVNSKINEYSYIELSPTKINANHMCDGFFVDTKSADWSLGTPAEGNEESNISGKNGSVSLKSAKDIFIGGHYDIDLVGEIINIGNDENGFLMGATPTINIGTPYENGLETNSPNIYTAAQTKNEIIGEYNLTLLSGFNITAENSGVNITGNCYATAFYETSDENLKDFSDDINVDFNKLKEIRKSYFTWKDGDQNLHIGTSAQDIQKNYPELVSEDKNGNLTVDYAKLSLIALSAIDKLDERLSKIEKMLNIE